MFLGTVKVSEKTYSWVAPITILLRVFLRVFPTQQSRADCLAATEIKKMCFGTERFGQGRRRRQKITDFAEEWAFEVLYRQLVRVFLRWQGSDGADASLGSRETV